MSTRYSSLQVPVKTLALEKPAIHSSKPAGGRPRESLQISSRLVSDILRPAKNVRFSRG